MSEDTEYKLNICYHPDPVLRTKTAEIEQVAQVDRNFIKQMFSLMYQLGGIGLAAPQVGSKLRVFVLDLQEDEVSRPLVFINPKLEATSEQLHAQVEGCLSLPGVQAEIERPKIVTVSAYDLEGKRFEIQAEGMLAVCMQHELDHLNGVLFFDHLSWFSRERLLKKFRKLHK